MSKIMTGPEFISTNNNIQDKLETLKCVVTPVNAHALNGILHILIDLSDKPALLEIISSFASRLRDGIKSKPHREISDIVDNATASVKETLKYMDGIKLIQKK